MNLLNFEDLFNPVNEIINNLNYKNIGAKDKYNAILKNKKLIHEFDDTIDNGLLHAITYYNNLNCFIVFGKNKSDSYRYYLDVFKNDYSLYGIKYMTLNSLILPKIMYQLLCSRMIIRTKSDLYNALESEFKFINNYVKNNYHNYVDVTILIVCKKDLNKKYPSYDIHDDNFFVYIPNTKQSIINASSIFFCENSIKFLELQNFDFFLTKDNENSKNMFLKYINWLNENINIIDRSQFMLFSSVVLYLLGHRSMNDLDLYVHSVPEHVLLKLDNLKNDELFNFLEFKVKNTPNWPNYWNTWLDSWAQKSGAKYFEEIIANPKFHFYFLGVKIISLNCDIIRRIERNRPNAIADLIALKKRYKIEIKIPNIPEKNIKYIPINDKTQEEINKLINDGGKLCNINNEIIFEIINDKSKFINTIIHALESRYKMTFTFDEIKNELNITTAVKKIKILKK